MIRRPRRSLPAALTALILLAVCVVVAVAAVQALLGQPPFLSFTTGASLVVGRAWSDPVLIAAGVVAAVLGLVLLVAALLPGTPTVIPLSTQDGATGAGVHRRTLATDLTTTARGAGGVTRAKLTVGRRRIRAAVTGPVDHPTRTRDEVQKLLTDRLADIAPARSPRLRVKVAEERVS